MTPDELLRALEEEKAALQDTLAWSRSRREFWEKEIARVKREAEEIRGRVYPQSRSC